MPTPQDATVTRSLQSAFRSLSDYTRFTTDLPARRRAVREANIRLGAAVATALVDASRPIPPFLGPILAERRAVVQRLAAVRPEDQPSLLLRPLAAITRQRTYAHLRSIDLELSNPDLRGLAEDEDAEEVRQAAQASETAERASVQTRLRREDALRAARRHLVAALLAVRALVRRAPPPTVDASAPAPAGHDRSSASQVEASGAAVNHEAPDPLHPTKPPTGAVAAAVSTAPVPAEAGTAAPSSPRGTTGEAASSGRRELPVASAVPSKCPEQGRDIAREPTAMPKDQNNQPAEDESEAAAGGLPGVERQGAKKPHSQPAEDESEAAAGALPGVEREAAKPPRPGPVSLEPAAAGAQDHHTSGRDRDDVVRRTPPEEPVDWAASRRWPTPAGASTSAAANASKGSWTPAENPAPGRPQPEPVGPDLLGQAGAEHVAAKDTGRTRPRLRTPRPLRGPVRRTRQLVDRFGRPSEIPGGLTTRLRRPAVAALVMAVLLGLLVALPTGAVAGQQIDAARDAIPDLSELEKLRRPERTEVFDRNGTRIAVLRDEQDRVVLSLDEIPPIAQAAFLAAEDERFYQHRGVDWQGIARAAVRNLAAGSTDQGGSTITQQLVRNVYPDLTDRSLARKINEATLAIQLEKESSKPQILEDYMNQVYLGNGYYGVEAASQGYFGRSSKDIKPHEAALLGAIIRAPEGINPRSESETTQQRVKEIRNGVLGNMARLGDITPEESQAAQDQPVEVRERLPQLQYPYFVDYLINQLIGDAPSDNVSKQASDGSGDRRLGTTYEERKRVLFEGGLQITTTLDLPMQRAAESAVESNLPPDSETEAGVGLVSVEPGTGAVRAMVGGRDYQNAKFNYAVQAKRNPGSTFKSFVLAAAIEEGISPESQWEASGWSTPREVCGSPWVVGNYEGRGNGPMTLRRATALSTNGVYARVMEEVCPEKVADMAERLGAAIPEGDRSFPAIALGGTSLTVLDMANSHATLAANGRYHEPTVVERVTKRSTDELLWERDTKGEQRVDPGVAYATTDVLKGVLTGGTATVANIGRPCAGKTGTAQNYSNAWFVGYCPELSTAVWLGNPQGDVQFTIAGDSTVTGGSYPALIWRDFMAEALKDQPVTDFERPAKLPSYRFVPPPPPPPPSTTTPVPDQQPTPGQQPQPAPQPDSPGTTAPPAVTSPPTTNVDGGDGGGDEDGGGGVGVGVDGNRGGDRNVSQATAVVPRVADG